MHEKVGLIKSKKASVRQLLATEFGQNKKWSDTDRVELSSMTGAGVAVKAGKNRNKIAAESQVDRGEKGFRAPASCN